MQKKYSNKRNLFINNHILSHAIQEFLLLSTVSVWHSPHCVNNTRHPTEEDPPTMRNRLPRNGIDIYLPHILFIVGKKLLLSTKRELYKCQQRRT